MTDFNATSKLHRTDLNGSVSTIESGLTESVIEDTEGPPGTADADE